MTESNDDLRRLVEEAARAAKAAQETAERVARDQPSWWERLIDSITRLLTTLADTVFMRLRNEIEGAKRAGRDLIADTLDATARTLGNVGAAIGWGMMAVAMLMISAGIFAVGLVVWLNQLLGDPAGTFAAGAAYFVVALLLVVASRSRLRALERVADGLRRMRRDS